jgi:hypothetical protein
MIAENRRGIVSFKIASVIAITMDGRIVDVFEVANLA